VAALTLRREQPCARQSREVAAGRLRRDPGGTRQLPCGQRPPVHQRHQHAGARRIADEIRLSIEYYHTTVPDARRVETTVMAGPGIAIEGLPSFFEAELGMPVQPRSMGQVEVQPGALDGVEAAELTVATGLALDEVPA